MKPEDLKIPFSWNNPSVLIKDRVFYVPEKAENIPSFTFTGWSHADYFGNDKPVCLEYCSGNGAWIAAKALETPFINWVALERKFSRVRKIWSKVKNLSLDNLIAICGEGQNVTKNYLPNESIDHVYVNFPDPWPKRRHAKNRLIQLEFIHEVCRILKKGGFLTFVTDDISYSEWMLKIMAPYLGFESVFPSPYYVNELSNYGTSYFEELWREKGKMIRYHQFKKK